MKTFHVLRTPVNNLAGYATMMYKSVQCQSWHTESMLVIRVSLVADGRQKAALIDEMTAAALMF